MRTATTRTHAARGEPGRHVLEVCDQPPVRPDTIGDREPIEGRNDDKHALDDLGGLHDRVPSRDLVSLTDGPGRPLRRGRSKAARSPKRVREQAEVRRGATTRRPRWFRQIVRSVPWPAVRLREGRAGRCDRCPASSPASAHRDGLAGSTRPRYRRRPGKVLPPGSQFFRPGTDGRLRAGDRTCRVGPPVLFRRSFVADARPCAAWAPLVSSRRRKIPRRPSAGRFCPQLLALRSAGQRG